MNTQKEAQGVKEYIIFIFKRVKYAKAGILLLEDNECKYYFELADETKEFMNEHKIFFKELMGKLSIKQAADLIGVTERQAFRILKRQRETFIEYIKDAEVRLFAKYPFENGTQKIIEVNIYDT